jgi:two-component system response regulator DesR
MPNEVPERVPPGHGRSDHAVHALIVDGHETTRLGLASLLEREPWIARCHQARDQREATLAARRHRPDVAALDISDMGPFAAHAVSALKDAHPGIAVVLTARCGNAPAPPASAGATAFVPNAAGARETLNAIRAAVVGDGPAPDAPADSPATAADRLTRRERDVLELMATGATNREIAARLHLGPDSVKKHAAAIYRKLGVRNRTEATQRALEVLG